jgi:S-adenosylmethionine-diacylgycerolhomoserine-N-methlytransferase
MDIKAGGNVLEVGCGTGRNLIVLAKKHPAARFYGLDASSAMLETAQSKIEAENIKNITLKTALADDFHFQKTFDLEKPFDAIFFSYALSIITPWKESIENALPNLKSCGSFYIVDFYDQQDLPKWFQRMLQGWLKQFHVAYPKELLPFLQKMEERKAGKLNIVSIANRYAFIAEFKKN